MRTSSTREKVRGVGFITKSLIAEMLNEPETYRPRLAHTHTNRSRRCREFVARNNWLWALHEVAWIREYEPNWTHAEIEEKLAHSSTTGEAKGQNSETVHALMDIGHPGRYRY